MEHEKHQTDPMHGAVSQRAVGIATSIAVFLAGVVMIVDNYHLGAGWAEDGPQAGYFPLRIGVILCIASAWLVYHEITTMAGAKKIFVTYARLRPVLAVLVPTSLYVAAIQLLGIYVASALFIAFFMRSMGEFAWPKTALVSVGTSAALFWMFEIQFMVPLPKGPLEAMFGY
jgi:putative tricarboxylic transport membrane protein